MPTVIERTSWQRVRAGGVIVAGRAPHHLAAIDDERDLDVSDRRPG